MKTPVYLLASLRVFLPVALALAIFAGCALTAKQKAAVSQFSDSASALGTVTSSELKGMRDEAVKMNIERLLLGGQSKDVNLADQASLDRGFALGTIEVVSGATRALAAYGKSLAALVDDAQSAELKAASNELIASFSRIPSVKEHISQKQLAAIGTAIQEVGGFWINAKRKQAVTTIVTASQAAVEHVCDLLIRDFDPKKGWVTKQLQVVEDPLMAEATNGLFDGRSYTERKISLEAFRLAHGNRMRRTEVLTRVTNAADGMKKANRALGQAIANSEWSAEDIQDFSKRVRSLDMAVKMIVTE
jgi:hypothetical protein